jgi:hypothetical protein
MALSEFEKIAKNIDFLGHIEQKTVPQVGLVFPITR